MKAPYSLIVAFWSTTIVCRVQSGPEALAQYQAFLSKLHTVEYEVQRIDTFPGKAVWNNKGQATLQPQPASNFMGARFLTTRFDAAKSYWYDGKTGYMLDDKAKTYEVDTEPYKPRVLGSPGGQMLVEELLAIGPGYESVTTTKSAEGRIIRLHYPDSPKTDELNRYTYLVLDETTNHPRMVRTVSDKAGGKWSTIKVLTNLRVNDAHSEQALNSKMFLTTYVAAVVMPRPGQQAVALLGKPAPGFNLTSFTKRAVRLSDYRGKTVLLDFWTTSCGPCISAMPKVQALQNDYGKQGLVVLGILMDPGSAIRAQGILKRRGATYTALLGNDDLEKAYAVNAYPRYVLINKNGKVTFDDTGYSPQLKAVIKAALID